LKNGYPIITFNVRPSPGQTLKSLEEQLTAITAQQHTAKKITLNYQIETDNTGELSFHLGDYLPTTKLQQTEPGEPETIGQLLDGTPLTLELPQPHILISGTTGSGKSTWINAIINTWQHQDAILYGIDLKQGAELNKWKQQFEQIATTPDNATKILTELKTIIEQRMQTLAETNTHKWTNQHGPWLVLIIDELAELTTPPTNLLIEAIRSNIDDKQINQKLKRAKDEQQWRRQLIASLARTSRAAGVTILCATQHPLAQTIGTELRANLNARIACRHNTPDGTQIALGPHNKHLHNEIPAHKPGTAHILNLNNHHTPTLARSHQAK